MGKVVFNSDIIRMLREEFNRHGFTAFEILLLVVGFAKVHCDLKIVWLMLKCGLIQIYGILTAQVFFFFFLLTAQVFFFLLTA